MKAFIVHNTFKLKKIYLNNGLPKYIFVMARGLPQEDSPQKSMTYHCTGSNNNILAGPGVQFLMLNYYDIRKFYY